MCPIASDETLFVEVNNGKLEEFSALYVDNFFREEKSP